MANILIVEDEENMRNIIAAYMKKSGHICYTAEDGVDALMLLKSNPVDLMILDIMIPHIDGFSVCKVAREMSSMPIIMLTARAEESDKLKGYECGADDYTTKPFSPKVLLAKVNALLRRSSFEPREVLSAGKISQRHLEGSRRNQAMRGKWGGAGRRETGREGESKRARGNGMMWAFKPQNPPPNDSPPPTRYLLMGRKLRLPTKNMSCFIFL